MKTPPLPGPVRNIDYPKIRQQQIENGLQVLCVEDSYLPRVSVRMAFPVGRITDPADALGLTQFSVEMLKEGTRSFNSRQIAEELDGLAIDFDTDTMMEHTVISMTVLRDRLEPAMALLTELVRYPEFPENELEKARTRWKSHLLSMRTDSGFLANERFSAHLFQNHPYSRYSIPLDHLERFGQERIKAFYQESFAPKAGLIVYAGNITPEEAHQMSSTFFGNWAGQGSLSPAPAVQIPVETRDILLVHRPQSVQSKIVIGTRTLTQKHPDFPILKAANQVFGGGASSRLFLNLREDKGYTYGAYSSIRSYNQEGVFAASSSVKQDKTRESLEAAFEEIERLATDPADKQELDRAKSELIGSFIRRMETPGSIGSLELNRRLRGLPDDYYQNSIPRIKAISSDEIQELAKKWLTPASMLVVVVADRSCVEQELRKLGPVRVFDSEGALLD